MSLFRYRAVTLAPAAAAAGTGSVLRGELAGESAAEVRARLRAGGLQVLDLVPVRPPFEWPQLGIATFLARTIERHLRARRHALKEEACDGLANLLESGVPLVESLETLAHGEAAHRRALQRVLALTVDQVRAGASLGAALREQRGWFDPVEVALIDAAEHGGNLSATLTRLAARQAKQSEVGQKVASALLYPAVVGVVGIAVWLFLSTQTLPELTRILVSAKVEVPVLTRAVMASGQFLVSHALAIVALVAAAFVLGSALLSRRRAPFTRFGIGALRRLRLARATGALAELLQGGVPLVEALDAIAPTAGSAELRASLQGGAAAIAEGNRWSELLARDAGRLYPTEFVRLVEMGETSGDLAPLLARLAERMERSAERQLMRWAALLEPAAILLLAALIGVVVAAAVLPLTRLQGVV
jgi:type II secretory pathway component PulF